MHPAAPSAVISETARGVGGKIRARRRSHTPTLYGRFIFPASFQLVKRPAFFLGHFSDHFRPAAV